MPIVTVTNMFPKAALDKLETHCDLRINQTDTPPTTEDLKKYALDSMVIVTYLSDKIDRDIIEFSITVPSLFFFFTLIFG